MRIKVLLILALSCMSMSTLLATSLKQVVSEVLDSNPVIMERLKNYRANREEIGIAEAGYYPTLDLQSAVGKKYTGRISNDITKETYDVTLQTIKVYMDLRKEKELLNNSKINVQHNEKLYNKVVKAYDAGLTSLSEVSKIQSSLSLAKSNMMVQKNRLSNAMFNYRRVTGRLIALDKVKTINFKIKLPKNSQKATMYALEYNPLLLNSVHGLSSGKTWERQI